MNGLSRWLLNVFFPTRCIFCNRLSEGDSWSPCPACAASDVWRFKRADIRTGAFFSVCICAGWYTGTLRDSVLRFKFGNHPEYARAYAPLLAAVIRTQLAGGYDLLSWIPVSPETLAQRGFDQARLLAEETATLLDTYAVPLLIKTGKNVPQSTLSHAAQRKENVAGVYKVREDASIARKRILLLDDILTTGATLDEGAKTLLKAGAGEVCAAAFCCTQPHI